MKRLFLFLLLLGGIQLAHAQYYKTDTVSRKGFDPSRMMIGGSLGLVFGDYTNINVSPLVGYRFSDMFAAGININAQYASEKDKYANGETSFRYQYTVFGGGVWGRFYPLEMLFLHAFPNGTPDGATDGNSSVITLQYTYTLQQAAALFAHYGHQQEAQHYQQLATTINQAVYERCFDQGRNEMANTPLRNTFSQHDVQPKETAYGIAKRYNITIEQLQQWNNLPGTDIKIGQRLLVGK